MPPIPVHIDDPITPQKADGITPQTSQPQQQPSLNNSATITAQPSQAYPFARPGATAAPAPTPYISQPLPQPTRTTQQTQDGPPPPQPGAVSIPPSQQVATSALPPPPKPGEAAKAREASITQLPPQMVIPPPTTNYASTHSTTTADARGGATTVNLGPISAPFTSPAAPFTSPAATSPAAPTGVPTAPHQPPEGYRQNTSAQELSAAQRRSLEEQERRESAFSSVSLGGTAGHGSGTGVGGGDGGVGEAMGSAWTAVKGFMGTAGEKLAGAEDEVWKRITSGR